MILRIRYKNLHRFFFRFVTIHAFDRHIDRRAVGRTDGHLPRETALHSMQRGKKHSVQTFANETPQKITEHVFRSLQNSERTCVVYNVEVGHRWLGQQIVAVVCARKIFVRHSRCLLRCLMMIAASARGRRVLRVHQGWRQKVSTIRFRA